MTPGAWIPSAADIAAGRKEACFGMTIIVINGGLEGDLDETDGRVWTRANMYKKVASYNGANISGEQVNTLGMQGY
jgi:hypothetical protein